MTDRYLDTSRAASRLFMNSYSSSFGIASRLFAKPVRLHMYNVYGLTRLADEIVDTYRGAHAEQLLDELEAETHRALERGYSANPIVHAFQDTARTFGFERELLQAFFSSMRTDLRQHTFTKAEYRVYIHGSAEVVGLMCLHVFCASDQAQYRELQAGASRLGAAYQKVNFLRDIATDYRELGRMYFPGIDFDTMTEADKAAIVTDIEADFAIAEPALQRLPPSAQRAVRASYRYYSALLAKLKATPIEQIKTHRIRISNVRKLRLLV